jgi:hypothetical protein
MLRACSVISTRCESGIIWEISDACEGGLLNALLNDRLRTVQKIGYEHVPRRMGNAKRRPNIGYHGLRRYPTRPEDRNFAFADFDGIAIVRFVDVRDADLRGIAKMHGRPVN